MKINYIIACWSGDREATDKDYESDHCIHLKKHLKSLNILEHSLSQITIAVPHNPNEPTQFTNLINSLPQKIKETKVVLHRRKNIGLSYGSYSDVYEKYRKEFDFYIFIEDDYIFVKNNFDKILVDIYETKKCTLLCSLATMWPSKKDRRPEQQKAKKSQRPLAIISNSITSTLILEKIWRKYNSLPHIPKNGLSSQVLFSDAFLELGVLADFSDRYAIPFNALGKLKIFEKSLYIPPIYESNNYNLPSIYDYLIVPTQCQKAASGS